MIADGLKTHFSIMLYSGLATLAVLLFLLVLRAIRREKLGALLPFFAIPVVLMGFPFFETIKINQDGVELKKLARLVEEEPENAEARAEFDQLLLTMDSRPYQRPDNLFELARAHVVAGDTGTALRYVGKTLEADPGFEPAHALKLELSTGLAPGEPPGHLHKDLGRLIERVRASNRDMAAREELNARLEELEAGEQQDTETLHLMVEGWAALEEVERARRSLEVLREKDPEHPEIPGLMRRLRFTR